MPTAVANTIPSHIRIYLGEELCQMNHADLEIIYNSSHHIQLLAHCICIYMCVYPNPRALVSIFNL